MRRIKKLKGFYTVSDGAKLDLSAMHNEYTYSKIIAHIRESGIISYGQWNREYLNLRFSVNEGKIMAITFTHLDKPARYYTFSCLICWDAKQIEVGDECLNCNGKGCSHCKDGLIFKKVTCPNCLKFKVGKYNEWHNRNKFERQQCNGNGRPIPKKAKRDSRRKTGS